MGLDYRVIPVNIGRGEQFLDAFTALSPNQRIPAIIDHAPVGGGAPIALFESGAILLYLAEKTGEFLPANPRARYEVIQWLFWQVAGLGPMLGQNGHFGVYAEQEHDYAIARYAREARRLYAVLDRRLAGRAYLCGAYSIADMACWPWIVTHKRQRIDLSAFPNVRRWYDALKQRPGLRRGFDLRRDLRSAGLDAEARRWLFARDLH
jgi:GSH-dependent disulfide-bond oxidoreductase